MSSIAGVKVAAKAFQASVYLGPILSMGPTVGKTEFKNQHPMATMSMINTTEHDIYIFTLWDRQWQLIPSNSGVGSSINAYKDSGFYIQKTLFNQPSTYDGNVRGLTGDSLSITPVDKTLLKLTKNDLEKGRVLRITAPYPFLLAIDVSNPERWGESDRFLQQLDGSLHSDQLVEDSVKAGELRSLPVRIIDSGNPGKLYYVNLLGAVYAIRAASAGVYTECADGVYINPSIGEPIKLELDRCMYNAKETMVQPIVLFNSEVEAAELGNPTSYNLAVESAIKAEQQRLKQQQSVDDDVAKERQRTMDLEVATIKHQRELESGHLKVAAEGLSYGAKLIGGIAAAGLAIAGLYKAVVASGVLAASFMGAGSIMSGAVGIGSVLAGAATVCCSVVSVGISAVRRFSRWLFS